MKKKVLLSSIMTIALCLSLIAGSTFALFTSTDKVNVAVNAGNVKISAIIDENTLQTWSLEKEQKAGSFANGGTAKLADGKNLVLDRMTPGDKVQFNIAVTNLSDVHTLYRIRMISNAVDGAKDLTPALVTTAVMTRENVAETYIVGGTEKASPWGKVLTGNDYADILVTVEFPNAPDNNKYQDAEANITFVVDAVQGNANAIDLDKSFEKGGYISSGNVPHTIGAEGLFVGKNDVTLYDIELNQAPAFQSYVLGIVSGCGTLTLDAGTKINVANNCMGVVAMGGNIVINDGAKISASGSGSVCMLVQVTAPTTLTLNGSDWFDAKNGAYAIQATTGGSPFYININSDTPLTDAEYLAMLGFETTMPAGVRMTVNGRVILNTIQNP